MLKDGGSDEVDATYHKNYVRNGSIFNEGEQGVLLNDAAVDTLVNTTIELLSDLSIRQAKGYMYVESIEVDYNSGGAKSMMRVKHNPAEVISEKGTEEYALYYEGK